MIIDIIILFIIGLSLYSGYKKGLVGILVSLVGFALAIILALSFQDVLTNSIINNTRIDDTLSSTVNEAVTKSFKENASQNSNEFYKQLLIKFGESQDIQEITDNITIFIIKGISFVIIFVVVLIIVYILQMFLNLVFDLPILSSVNKFGGVAASGIMSVFKIWIVMAIINFLEPLNMLKGVLDIIYTTNFTKFLYENNLIISVLTNNLKL